MMMMMMMMMMMNISENSVEKARAKNKSIEFYLFKHFSFNKINLKPKC